MIKTKFKSSNLFETKMRKRGFLIALVIISLFLISNVKAVNIGISPAEIQFTNVLRGGYSQTIVVITSDSAKPVRISLKPRGEISEWLNFSEQSFKVTNDKPYLLEVSVNPPSDMPNGNYTGFLRVETESLGEGIEGHATGIVKTALDLYIVTEVTDVEFRKCSANNFKVSSVEKGDDIVFTLDIANQGNIRLKPRIKIDIWDQEQIQIVKQVEFSSKEILPTIKDKFTIRVKSDDMELGQYWAEISAIDCYSAQTLTFDVLEPGALKAEGILLGITVKRFAETGETLPIQVDFKNTGEKEVSAQFKGRITTGEKIVEILESERFTVPINEVTNFTFFFTPKDTGRYVISGRVFYSGKRTFESSSVLEVFQRKFNLSSVLLPAVYLILIFFIGYLLFKIRKERKSYNLKLKTMNLK